MARKKKHEEHENHERWLVSYADFITLLFAFFVVMYSVSSVNEGKYRVLSDAMVAAFRASAKSLEPIQIGKQAKTPFDAPLSIKKKPAVVAVPDMAIPKKKSDVENPFDQPGSGEGADMGAVGADAMAQMAENIEEALGALIADDLVKVVRTEQWLEVQVNASILFDSGEGRVDESSYPVIEKLADIVRPFPNQMQVEGYTDNQAIASHRFPSNWALSAFRAADVVKLFEGYGVHPARMAAIGMGENNPIADNSTEEGREKNRRVSLIIMNTRDPRRDFELDSAGIMTDDFSLETSEAPLPDGTGVGLSVDGAPVLDSRSALSETRSEAGERTMTFDSATRGAESAKVIPTVKPLVDKPIKLPPVIPSPFQRERATGDTQ